MVVTDNRASCDRRHSGFATLPLPRTTGAVGTVLLKQESDVTKSNNNMRELTFNEVDRVSGGGAIEDAAAAAHISFWDRIEINAHHLKGPDDKSH